MSDLGRVGEILVKRIDRLENSFDKLRDEQHNEFTAVKKCISEMQLAYEVRFNKVNEKVKDLSWKFYLWVALIGSGGGIAGSFAWKAIITKFIGG